MAGHDRNAEKSNLEPGRGALHHMRACGGKIFCFPAPITQGMSRPVAVITDCFSRAMFRLGSQPEMLVASTLSLLRPWLRTYRGIAPSFRVGPTSRLMHGSKQQCYAIT